MRGGVARRRSGGVDAATALLRDDDSRPSNVSGNFALHVLVASDSDGVCGQEPCDTAGENVVVTETRVSIPWRLSPPSGRPSVEPAGFSGCPRNVTVTRISGHLIDSDCTRTE
jgi:hypothetical protein